MWSDEPFDWKHHKGKILRQYETMEAKKCMRNRMTARHLTCFLAGILFGLTLINICYVTFQHLSIHIAYNTFRWYRVEQNCKFLSRQEWTEQHEIVDRSSKVFRMLGISAPTCYGTLWGVLRMGDVLPWDTNIDFCILDEYFQNISFSEMKTAFNSHGVDIDGFSIYSGSYRLKRGSAQGFLNVFVNCTRYVTNTFPELRTGKINPGEDQLQWACSSSLASFVGKFTQDFNRPFPIWILSPPFKKLTLGGINVSVPNDDIEMQKYIYPEDWWLEARPIGCLGQNKQHLR